MNARYRAIGRAFSRAVPRTSAHTRLASAGPLASEPTASTCVSVISAAGTPCRRSASKRVSTAPGRTAAATTECPGRAAETILTRLMPSNSSSNSATADIAAASPKISRLINLHCQVPRSASHPRLRLHESGFELFGARAVDLGHGFLDRVGERLVHRFGGVRVVDGDHAAGADGQSRVHLLPDPAFEPMLGELAHHGAGGSPDRCRSK